MDLTVRDQVWKFLKENNVTAIFGNPGSTELPFFADWPTDVKWVMTLQEASATSMADGYAQATGKTAMVMLHSAAGVANGMAGIYTAVRNCSPIVVMAGQQVRSLHPTNPFLYAENSTLFPQPYTKWSIESSRAENVPLDLARAWHVAGQRPCGPAFISVPMDDWDVPAPHSAPGLRQISDRFSAPDEELEKVVNKLVAAKSPVIIVGPEVERDEATALALELVERIGAVVWLSPHTDRSGYPEDHPSFNGQLPPVKKDIRATLSKHDFVLVLGAPVFTYHVPGEGAPIPEGLELIQLSEDPGILARAEVGTGIRTSLKNGLSGMLKLMPKNIKPAAFPPVVRDMPEASSPMTSAYVLKLLGELLPENTVIVEETPTIREIRWQHMPIRKGGSYFSAGSGCLGWGLPASVGIALTDTRPVVCVVGDGSSQYSIQALWTAAQQGVKLLVLVLNNGEYAAMKELSLTLGANNPPSYSLPGIDIVSIAKGYGCHAVKVEDPTVLVDSVKQAMGHDGVTVLDIRIDPTIKPLYA